MKKFGEIVVSLTLCFIVLLGTIAIGGDGFTELLSNISITAFAASSGTCGDNLKWELDDNGLFTISGTGAMTNFNESDDRPWYSIRDSIKSVSIGSGVTSIGERAFSGCEGLTSITIPSSVASIGYRAFYYCEDLTNIEIPNGVTSIGYCAFANCTSLKDITIPDSVTNIDNDAFWGCTGLTSVAIGSGVISIGRGMFLSCTSLININVDKKNTVYDSRDNCNAIIKTDTNTIVAGCKNTIIPDSVTSIGDYAFECQETLTGITIPNSVISIGKLAFYGCFDLASITIPDSVTNIGEEAFMCCTGLKSIEIPNSVTSIGKEAFCGCGFTNVKIGSGVKSMGVEVFGFCESLTSVAISDGVKSVSEEAFKGCESLKSIIIPSTVTRVGYRAFKGCTNLAKIYYIGSEDKWNGISILSDNDPLINAEKVFVSDINKLTLISSSPSNYDTVVSQGDPLVLTFNQPISEELEFPIIDESEIAVYDCITDEKIYSISDETYIFKVSFDENTLTIENAFKNLESGHKYYVKISPNVIKAQNNESLYFDGINNKFSLRFTITDSVRIMSYNLYSSNDSSKENVNGKSYNLSYSHRAKYLAQNVLNCMPDSFGVQEITQELLDEFENATALNGKTIASSYDYVGAYRGKDGTTKNEGCLIFYNKNKYDCSDYGTVWLTDDKDNPVSKHSQANYYRVFTYAVLQNITSGNIYLHINTQLEHTHETNDAAALDAADQIIKFIKANYPNIPTVITGDFNQIKGTSTYNFFINCGFTDARTSYSGNENTYHNWFQMGEDGSAYSAKTIDHILYNNGFTITENTYEVCNEDYTDDKLYGDYVLDYPYPSDHHPIKVDVKMANQVDNFDYNLGEETYSFENYDDDDSDGHCFGIATTSSAYYNGLLDVSDIGIDFVQKLNNVFCSDDVRSNICKYQARQEYDLISESIVAGGSWYLTDEEKPLDDWNDVVNHVKEHNYDNKGSLILSFSTRNEEIEGDEGIGRHAVNFLYYAEVNGESRIYIYDSNFPDCDCYLYKDENNNIIESPYSTFDSEYPTIDIQLIDVDTYFKYTIVNDDANLIYASAGEIKIAGIKGAPMAGSGNSKLMYCYEIPDNTTKIEIIPLKDNAEFTYNGKKYHFNKINEDTVATFKFADIGTENEKVIFNIENEVLNISITNYQSITVDHKSTVTLHATCDTEGVSIAWFDANSGNKLVSGDTYTAEKVTSTFSVYAAAVDESGNKIDNTESEVETVTVKSGFFDKIIAFFRGLFGSLPKYVDNKKQ